MAKRALNKKVLIGAAAIGLAVIAAAILFLDNRGGAIEDHTDVVSASEDKGYEEVVRQYYRATEQEDLSKLLPLYSYFLVHGADEALMQQLESQQREYIRIMREHYGTYILGHSIAEARLYSVREYFDLYDDAEYSRDQIETWYEEALAYGVERYAGVVVDCTINGTQGSYSVGEFFWLVKMNGSWYIESIQELFQG